jgi:hypothetical protein
MALGGGHSLVVGGGLNVVGNNGLNALIQISNLTPQEATVVSETGVPVATFARNTHLVVGTGVQILGAGRYTTSSPAGAVLIGNNIELQTASGTLNKAVVIGNSAIARSTSSLTRTTVIGNGASVIGTAIDHVTVVGDGATAGADSCVLIGDGTSNGSSQHVVAVGPLATVANASSDSVAIGYSANITGQRNTIIGANTSSLNAGADNIAIGQSAITGAIGATSRAIAIGSNAQAIHDDAINIGTSSVSFQSQTIMLTCTNGYTTLLVGKGNTSGSPAAVTFRLTNATGADIVGAHMILQAGLSTGVAAPAVIQMNIGQQRTTGSTLQTAYAAFKLSHLTVGGSWGVLDTPTVNDRVSLRFAQAQAEKALVGVAGALNDFIAGAGVGDLCIVANGGKGILFSKDGGTTLHHYIEGATGRFVVNFDRGLRVNNQTSSAGASAGTLGNAPAAGNPGYWWKVNIDGTNYAIPCWLG